MKLEPHAEKPGQTLKIWFPYPVACESQPADEIKVLSSSHPVTVTGTCHRAAYMEVPCEAGTTYSVRYSFVNRAKYTPLDLDRTDYPPVGEGLTTDELAYYTGEQYPHIRFTPFIKELAAEIAGDVLYGLDARRLEYKMTEGDKAYAVIQRTVKYRGDFVSLVLYATGDGMNVYSDFIDLIVENFTLSEKQAAANTPKVDKKTPEGMQIASSDIVEYRLYAPLSWVCDADSGISEAYYPESEKTNVTVTSYSPSAEERGMSLADYVEKCLVEYKTSIKNFPNEIVVSDLEVAGKEAKSIEFGAVYGDSTYKLRQVMFYASEFDLYYTFTYTATAEKYAQHMADFEAMVAAFTFR